MKCSRCDSHAQRLPRLLSHRHHFRSRPGLVSSLPSVELLRTWIESSVKSTAERERVALRDPVKRRPQIDRRVLLGRSGPDERHHLLARIDVDVRRFPVRPLLNHRERVRRQPVFIIRWNIP